MNEVEILVFVFAYIYVFGIPLLTLFSYTISFGFTESNFKKFYFNNGLIIKLNTFGRFCYYVLACFALVYYYIWINLSKLLKLIFLKRV